MVVYTFIAIMTYVMGVIFLVSLAFMLLFSSSENDLRNQGNIILTQGLILHDVNEAYFAAFDSYISDGSESNFLYSQKVDYKDNFGLVTYTFTLEKNSITQFYDLVFVFDADDADGSLKRVVNSLDDSNLRLPTSIPNDVSFFDTVFNSKDGSIPLLPSRIGRFLKSRVLGFEQKIYSGYFPLDSDTSEYSSFIGDDIDDDLVDFENGDVLNEIAQGDERFFIAFG